MRELRSVSNTNLVKVDLHGNDISYHGIIVLSECKFATEIIKEINFSDEKLAALLLLNTFDTISNLGGALVEDLYDPDIEGALRINLTKRPFTDEGITQTWPSNTALWLFMPEKVYNNSLMKVYDEGALGRARRESKMKKKCATELFHMVHYGSIFAVDQCPQHGISTATIVPATKKQ